MKYLLLLSALMFPKLVLAALVITAIVVIRKKQEIVRINEQ